MTLGAAAESPLLRVWERKIRPTWESTHFGSAGGRGADWATRKLWYHLKRAGLGKVVGEVER